jgi:hypothetical protein
MSENPPEFELLMEQVRAGSPQAVRQLLDTYGPTILRAVRRVARTIYRYLQVRA